MTLGDPNAIKVIKGIRPKIDGNSGATVSIQVGSSMTPDGAVTWAPAATFTIGTDFKVDTFSIGGRYMSVKFSNIDYAPWRMKSFSIDYVSTGAY